MKNKFQEKKHIGRPKTFDREEVIKLAMHHFWEHGYDNSSLDDLLSVMGIKKSSFYHTFKNKEELFSSCLDMYRKEVLLHLKALKEKVGPKEAMLRLTADTIKELESTGKVKGCLIINSGKECYNKYADLKNQIALEFNFMQDIFVDFIKEAQELGEISKNKEAKIISGRYMNNLNGLVVTIQAGATKELIADIVKSLKEILE